MKKLAIILLSVIACLTIGYAQTTQPKVYTIKGVTMDSVTQKAVGYATVLLMDTAKQQIKAVPSESDGKFSMTHNKPGKYLLSCTFVGYNEIVMPVELNMERVVELGALNMVEGLQLEAATVIGKLITTDIDKTTYNTAADPETPALTALEMMRKVPMLTVDGEENLQLKGQTNFKILVNGKNNSMMSRDYKQVLRSMPASSIKNIEVITNPPAKYDAEGFGGVINIVTNRKTNDSYNGSLSLRGDHFGGYGGSGYIAAGLGKFGVSANVFGGSYRRPGGESIMSGVNNKSDEYRYSSSGSTSDSRSTNYGASIDASYEIDTLNLISLSFWGFLGSSMTDSDSWSDYHNVLRELTRQYRQNTTSNNQYGSISGNIDYQRSFKKKDRTLTASYRMDYNPDGSNFDTKLDGTLNYDSYHQYSDNSSWGAEHTLQIDFYEPITKEHTLEAGVKYILRPNVSDTKNYYNDEIDLNRKNDLDYLQHIASAYASYQYRLKKFSVKAGLRAEYTVNTGTFKLKEEHEMFNRYFNVVPFATISYKPTDEQNIRLGYTQRLSRPGIWYMNPYINDQNPGYISTGNPDLESAISHSVDLGWSIYKKRYYLNLSTSARLNDNGIENVSTMRDDGVMYSTYANIGRSLYLGVLNVSASVNFFDNKLRFNINGGIAYQEIEQKGVLAMKNQGWSGNVSGGLNAQPWKNGNINIYVGYYYPSVGLQRRGSEQFYNNLSITQNFLNRKLSLTVFCSNPFEKKRTSSNESFGDGFYQTSSYSYYSRTIGASLQWRFGKMVQSVKKARRGINNEDKMSGGGGASQGGGGQ